MLSLLAFSAMHMNVVLAAQSFSDAQSPIDHHSQTHESQENDHFSCPNDLHETLSHRVGTEHHDALADCPIAQVTVPVVELPRIVFSQHADRHHSRKPITLTHHIVLRT